MTKPQPPESLGDTGRELWRQITDVYDLRSDELRVLASACTSADLEAEFMKQWREMGSPLLSRGSMGQEVEHPLIGSIDKQAKSKAAFLKQLKLPDPQTGERPNQQRDAAQSRWAAAHGRSA